MNRELAIVPLPSAVQYTGGELRLPVPVPVHVPERAPGLRRLVDVCGGKHLAAGGPVLQPAPPDDIRHTPAVSLAIESGVSGKDGSYRLSVAESGVSVCAASARGLFYGLQSLLQLLGSSHLPHTELTLPQLQIADSPRFAWRGMHLDVSRHFFPVAFVEKYIDLLAFHKMNMFHWHLTDDQGWRIEIERYPRLTEIGAWRLESDGRRYGGFYTQAEIRRIVQYAAERFVTVVPEIELPGHASAALAAYPEYSCTAGPFPVATTWGVFDDVYCVGQDATFAFLENVLDEVATLFRGEYIHIGGDECPKVRWRAHDLCQKRKKDIGLKDEDDLQSYFVSRIARHLRSLGKRVVGWDEILDGGAPEGATIMAWRGVEKGVEAARAGHAVVMCPMSHCYFDHYQSLDGEPKAIGGHTPLEKVCGFEPVPAGLPADLSQQIVGAQGNVWTEYMPDERHVEYMVFPRLCALAEVLWTPPDRRSPSAFLKRLRPHLDRLERWPVNYRRLTA